jgi:hypothetical protein
MSKTVTVHLPDGWGDDELLAFFEHARGNAFASFVQMPEPYVKLLEVDAAFLLINSNLKDPEDFSAPFFMFKAHSSYRAAAWLAMTGHSPEAFMVMRGCIESALYGLYLNRNEKSFRAYMSRHDDETTRQAVRREFTIRRMWSCLRDVDGELQAKAEQVYNKTIDFGAHPNVAALIAATTMTRTKKGVRFTLAYLTEDQQVLQGTMKSVAQAGVVALSVFRHIFNDRYDRLGLTESLPQLRQEL